MVFVNRKHDADKVARMLCQRKHTAVSIHGDKLQDERMRVLSQFTRGQAQIIVCTDVAARGLDIKGVSHVVNYDLPFSGVEDWVHRVGRTGRAGVKGTAHTFVRFARSCDRAETIDHIWAQLIYEPYGPYMSSYMSSYVTLLDLTC